MTTIRRVLVIVLVAIALGAPAAAHEDHGRDEASAEPRSEHVDDESGTAADPDRNGVDGTEPMAFVALFVAGIAAVGAVAALIFGTRRVPA